MYLLSSETNISSFQVLALVISTIAGTFLWDR